jgi:hypothetical protein
MPVARKPWWQVTKTPKQGFWLAGANCLLAVTGWVRVAVTEEDILLAVVIAVGWSLLAAGLLAPSVALRRRESR